MTDYAQRLNAVNQQLQFTNIKGKEYAQVNQRILAFWSLFPNGRIVTSKTDDGTRCDFVCEVYRDAADELPTTTGHAFEYKQGNINSTSYVENCETSAIGRALGLLGIGATTAVASAEEVGFAIGHQETKAEDPLAPAKRELWAALKAYAEKTGKTPEEALEGVKRRPEWATQQDSAEWLLAVAREYRELVDG